MSGENLGPCKVVGTVSFQFYVPFAAFYHRLPCPCVTLRKMRHAIGFTNQVSAIIGALPETHVLGTIWGALLKGDQVWGRFGEGFLFFSSLVV